MQRVIIITVNCVLLVFLLIGLPAATRAQWGNVQFSSANTGRQLMFWGLGIAVAANILGAFFLLKVRKQKVLCWEWAAVFSVLWLVFYAFTLGKFNFHWLRQALEWLQKHL
ncbi:MAG TPA: hypothetical protein VGO57_16485 [Verrucomicrobiae bacterium]|jgi:hypothetical protein